MYRRVPQAEQDVLIASLRIAGCANSQARYWRLPDFGKPGYLLPEIVLNG
jgi:hypothetical protein